MRKKNSPVGGARPLVGNVDPAALYDGVTTNHLLDIHPTTRWRMTKRGALEPVYLPGVAGPRFRGSNILALQGLA